MRRLPVGKLSSAADFSLKCPQCGSPSLRRYSVRPLSGKTARENLPEAKEIAPENLKWACLDCGNNFG